MRNTYLFFDEKTAQGYLKLRISLGHKAKVVKGKPMDLGPWGVIPTWNVIARYPKNKNYEKNKTNE